MNRNYCTWQSWFSSVASSDLENSLKIGNVANLWDEEKLAAFRNALTSQSVLGRNTNSSSDNSTQVLNQSLFIAHHLNCNTFQVDHPLRPGEICMKKVVMVEEIIYDQEVKCEHVSYESCFFTFQSVMKKGQKQECKTQFEKVCELEYRDVPKPQVGVEFGLPYTV